MKGMPEVYRKSVAETEETPDDLQTPAGGSSE